MLILIYVDTAMRAANMGKYNFYERFLQFESKVFHKIRTFLDLFLRHKTVRSHQVNLQFTNCIKEKKKEDRVKKKERRKCCEYFPVSALSTLLALLGGDVRSTHCAKKMINLSMLEVCARSSAPSGKYFVGPILLK